MMHSNRNWIIVLKVFAVAFFYMVICVGNYVFAEEGEKVIVLSERVGEVIDREERDYFRMFQAYEGFKSAIFLELPDGNSVAEITYEEDGEEKKIRWPQSAESIESLRNYIDNYEEVSAKIFDDEDKMESPGEMVGVLCVPDSNHIQILTTKDGSRLVGRIVEVTESDVKFESKLGIMTISISDIKEIKEIAVSAMKEGTYWFPNPNATRLFFAATGRSLKKGEGYFADYYLFFPLLAIGVTDYVTLAGGMSLLPTGLENQIFYLMPKIGIIQKEGGALSVGIMMLKFPNWEDDEGPTVGIAYGVGTLGSSNGSLTAGLGYGYVDWDFADTPMVMVGGEKRISRRVALVTENWWIPGVDTPLVSGGVRFFGERVSVDLALIQVLEHPFFPGIPYIDFVVQF